MSEYKELKYEYEIGKSGQIKIETQFIYLYLPMEEYQRQIDVINKYNEDEFVRYQDEAGWEDWMDLIDEHHKNYMKESIPPDDDNYDDYMAIYNNDEPLDWTINTINAIQALLWRDVYGHCSTPSIDPVPLQNKPNTPVEWFA